MDYPLIPVMLEPPCSRFEYQGHLMIKFARAVYDHQKPPPQRVMDLLNSRFWELG